MRSIKEVSELSGVSRRTLQYYDRIGLLKPTSVTQAGYRLYDDEAIETLQQILLYRELQFPLKDIRRIMQRSDFDRNRALEEQIELLTMKKEHLDNLILFARGLYGIGVKRMDFSAFDTRRLDEYIEQAKKNWDQTKEYQEFEQKQKGRSKEDDQRLEEARIYCRDNGLNLSLVSGAEINWTYNTVEALRQGRVHSLNDSEFALIELWQEVSWYEVQSISEKLLRAGFTPIFAHVERYRCFLWQPDKAVSLKRELPVYYQMNAGFLL